MITLNKSTLTKFLKLAADTLDGEWVIFGGTVLPLLGVEHRATVDIDFVSKNKQDATFKLIRIADQLKLPMTTINQAGALFLYRIKNFEENLIEFYRGSKGAVYRPNLYLFIQLKVPRLSDSDLSDCLEYIRYSKKHGDTEHLDKIAKYVAQESLLVNADIKKKNLKKLLAAIANSRS